MVGRWVEPVVGASGAFPLPVLRRILRSRLWIWPGVRIRFGLRIRVLSRQPRPEAITEELNELTDLLGRITVVKVEDQYVRKSTCSCELFLQRNEKKRMNVGYARYRPTNTMTRTRLNRWRKPVARDRRSIRKRHLADNGTDRRQAG
jgi:hypothetical protein